MKEYYNAHPMAADSTYKIQGPHVAAFLATVAGTITITDSTNTVLVNALPVAVGFNRIAILFNSPAENLVTLAGGAAGTLLV